MFLPELYCCEDYFQQLIVLFGRYCRALRTESSHYCLQGKINNKRNPRTRLPNNVHAVISLFGRSISDISVPNMNPQAECKHRAPGTRVLCSMLAPTSLALSLASLLCFEREVVNSVRTPYPFEHDISYTNNNLLRFLSPLHHTFH